MIKIKTMNKGFLNKYLFLFLFFALGLSLSSQTAVHAGKAVVIAETVSKTDCSPGHVDFSDDPIEKDFFPVPCGIIDIHDAILTALDNNLDIAQARKSLDEALSSRKIAYDSFDFTSSYSFSYTRTEYQDNSAGAGRNNMRHGVSFGKKLYNKSADLNMDMSDLGLETAKEQLRQASQNVIFNIYDSYISVLRLKELILVYEQNIVSHKANLELVKNQMNEGMRTRADLLRFEVALSNGYYQLQNAKANFQNAFVMLKKNMGINVESPIDIHKSSLEMWKQLTEWIINFSNPKKHGADNSLFNHALTIATNKRILAFQPAALLLEIMEKQVELNVDLARSKISGSVNLSVGASTSSADKFFDDKPLSYSGGISYSQPLFDTGSVKEQVNKAKIALERTRISIQDSLRGLKAQGITILNDLFTSTQKVKLMNKALEQSRENHRIMEERFAEGLISNVELIDAQDLLTLSHSNYITALYDFYFQYATYLNAMGLIDLTVEDQASERALYEKDLYTYIESVKKKTINPKTKFNKNQNTGRSAKKENSSLYKPVFTVKKDILKKPAVIDEVSLEVPITFTERFQGLKKKYLDK